MSDSCCILTALILRKILNHKLTHNSFYESNDIYDTKIQYSILNHITP